MLLYGLTVMLIVAAAIEAFWSSAQWLPLPGEIQRRGGVLDCRDRLLRRAGAPCGLMRSPSRLRPRSPLEAADLGVRLCQHAARDVYHLLSRDRGAGVRARAATYEWAAWLPAVLMLCVEAVARSHHPVRAVARGVRTAHHAGRSVARAAAGVVARIAVLLDDPASVAVAIVHRTGLSARRSVGLVGGDAHPSASAAHHGRRVDDDVGVRDGGDGADVVAGLPGLLAGAAEHASGSVAVVHRSNIVRFGMVFPLSYAAAVLFLEPFFVAAGFGMYLNRRAELEAWDIEQEFRRAFAA